MRTEKLKGKKHKFSLSSRFENRENDVIFPFFPLEIGKKKTLFTLFSLLAILGINQENREEKNMFCVIFFRGKIGKKKTYPKGYTFPFPCFRRSRGKKSCVSFRTTPSSPIRDLYVFFMKCNNVKILQEVENG